MEYVNAIHNFFIENEVASQVLVILLTWLISYFVGAVMVRLKATTTKETIDQVTAKIVDKILDYFKIPNRVKIIKDGEKKVIDINPKNHKEDTSA